MSRRGNPKQEEARKKPVLASLFEEATLDVFGVRIRSRAIFFGRHRDLTDRLNEARIPLREFTFTILKVMKSSVVRKGNSHLFEAQFVSEFAFSRFLEIYNQHTVNLYKGNRKAEVVKAYALNDEVQIGMAIVVSIANGSPITEEEAIAYVDPGQPWKRYPRRLIPESCEILAKILGVRQANSYKILGDLYAERRRLRETIRQNVPGADFSVTPGRRMDVQIRQPGSDNPRLLRQPGGKGAR